MKRVKQLTLTTIHKEDIMPVALLNELVLLGLGLYIGYKTGSKKEQVAQKAEEMKNKWFGKDKQPEEV